MKNTAIAFMFFSTSLPVLADPSPSPAPSATPVPEFNCTQAAGLGGAIEIGKISSIKLKVEGALQVIEFGGNNAKINGMRFKTPVLVRMSDADECLSGTCSTAQAFRSKIAKSCRDDLYNAYLSGKIFKISELDAGTAITAAGTGVFSVSGVPASASGGAYCQIEVKPLTGNQLLTPTSCALEEKIFPIVYKPKGTASSPTQADLGIQDSNPGGAN